MILDLYEKGEKFYLYTGRGPSAGALHVGHLLPFMFTKWLQDVFQCPLVIQLTDDEKFLWKDMTLTKAHELATPTATDIIACGFDVKKRLYLPIWIIFNIYTQQFWKYKNVLRSIKHVVYLVLQIVIILVNKRFRQYNRRHHSQDLFKFH